MSLREKMARYEKLTGDIAEHIPLGRLGGFLDGVDRGIEELEKTKAEIENMWIKSAKDLRTGKTIYENLCEHSEVLEIIDKHIEELKGKTE